MSTQNNLCNTLSGDLLGGLYLAAHVVRLTFCTCSPDESKLRQQQQDLEQSCTDVRLAVAGREAAEQSLQQVQAQLDESKVDLDKLCAELLIQQERSERGKAAAATARALSFQLSLV